ncbi:MAG TPA: fused MFS/spermidine synthase [Candidatus Anammoximicrobium sp.]|nr:fused MFS/spermidine synthase [Candidatus Anammoximicrobium sp.]
MNRRPFFYAAILTMVALVVLVRADQIVLYEKASPYSTIIVTEENGLRTLRFEKDGARQSVVKLGDPDHLELPYARVAFAGLALCGEPRRVMVVGLGGGTLPMFLRKHYPDAAIDAVDIDPDVVYVAEKFFGFRKDDRMQAFVGDGREFVERFRQPYDVIFLDAFSSDSVPPHLTTQEFLRAVRRAVKPSGVVVGNIWSRYSNPLYDSMVRTYQEVFDDLYILDVPGAGNKILLALPRRQSLTREELAQLAGKVSTAKQFRFDLSELVTTGFQHATEKDSAGRVLKDGELNQYR